jgi:hypothetical protein
MSAAVHLTAEPVSHAGAPVGVLRRSDEDGTPTVAVTLLPGPQSEDARRALVDAAFDRLAGLGGRAVRIVLPFGDVCLLQAVTARATLVGLRAADGATALDVVLPPSPAGLHRAA